MSLHRVRHSEIGAAIDATNGDVRKVQQLSGYADLNAIWRYDNNRQSLQKKISKSIVRYGSIFYRLTPLTNIAANPSAD
jgi:hypothetical protein